MAESRENPATNFQKTVAAQRARIENLKSSPGLNDSLEGSSIKGSVRAEYNRGSGGAVETSITSGGAFLDQAWTFDENGKVQSVQVRKQYEPAPGYGVRQAGELTLIRDEDGKFQVERETVGESSGVWAEEFAAARQKLSGHPKKSK